MAMKIKKRGNRRDRDTAEETPAGEPLEAEVIEDPDAGPEGAYADLDAAPPGFDAERAAYEGAAWFEKNRTLVLGGLAVLMVAAVAGWAFYEYTSSQEQAASEMVSEAIEPYSVLVETSPEYKQLQATPNFKIPEKTFATDEAKWQAIYKEAGEALEGPAQVHQPARLTRAAAAMRLGKYEEAAKLYAEAKAGSLPPTYETMVSFALAQALAAQEQYDKAIAELDQLAKTDDEQISVLARYRKGTLLEEAGKVEEAKALYHEILDKTPQNPFQADIKRRLAIL